MTPTSTTARATLSRDELVRRLEYGARLILAAAEGAGEDEARWKPPSGAWSIVEIVNHLADEEVEDFRMRVRLTLESPDAEWPPIDPEGVARSRDYQHRPWPGSLRRFEQAREESLAWLRGLDGAMWDPTRAHRHPKIGALAVGDLAASWAAHDLLHVRQLVKRRFEYLQATADPYRTDYAGAW
jgi:hypothetical protein